MVDLKVLGEGVSLGDIYTLEQYVRHDRSGAFFAASAGDGERVLIKLEPERNPEAERRFATWQRSLQLRHPNLLDIRDVGRGDVEGESHIYAVFEYPDDLLAPALDQGPLSEPETRDVLDAVLAGLRYLHSQGLVHGAIDPDHIVAVGERVKLATDGLRESEDLEGYREDVRQLGELVLGLRAPEPLGEPLATVVHHASAADPRQRWTLAELVGVLESSPRPATVAPPTPANGIPESIPAAAALVESAIPAPLPPAIASAQPEIPERDWSAESAPAPVESAIRREPETSSRVLASVNFTGPVIPEPVSSANNPVVPALPAPARPVRGEADQPSPGGFPKWILAALAILLFSILIFNLRRKPDTVPAAISPVSPVAKATMEPAPPPAGVPAAIAPASVRGVWRVIAFTFRSRDMAAKKAKQIDGKWPDLRASVFAPSGRRGYYLVALGDWMSREEAERVQHKARRLGLPRDTYVQNYSE
jgi:eukaryotic-like serine/threonine-protein kinase